MRVLTYFVAFGKIVNDEREYKPQTFRPLGVVHERVNLNEPCPNELIEKLRISMKTFYNVETFEVDGSGFDDAGPLIDAHYGDDCFHFKAIVENV